MTNINWKATLQECLLIRDIVKRATKLKICKDPFKLNMDITACHLNGNPLDLQGLLDAVDFDFAHDVLGISAHIDRETGELQDCFSPRFTKQQEEKENEND